MPGILERRVDVGPGRRARGRRRRRGTRAPRSRRDPSTTGTPAVAEDLGRVAHRVAEERERVRALLVDVGREQPAHPRPDLDPGPLRPRPQRLASGRVRAARPASARHAPHTARPSPESRRRWRRPASSAGSPAPSEQRVQVPRAQALEVERHPLVARGLHRRDDRVALLDRTRRAHRRAARAARPCRSAARAARG